MPEISIIIPVYNMETYIKRCMDSVISQTYRDFEVLLIDDGSTDKSGKICDEYKESDYRVRVYHKENGGVASAKNFGIEHASGSYITFIDSDDFVDSEYLAEMISTNTNDADMIIAGLRYLNSETLISSSELSFRRTTIHKSEFNNEIPVLLRRRALNYHVAKLYRRKLVIENEIRFTDFRITGADDTIFNFDFLKTANLVCVSDKNIYNYVLYQTSTSHRYSKDKWKRSLELDRQLYSISGEIGILSDEMKQELDNRVLFSGLWSVQDAIKNVRNYFTWRKLFLEIVNSNRFREAWKGASKNARSTKSIQLLYSRKVLMFYIREAGKIRKVIGAIYQITPRWIIRILHYVRGERNE